MWFSSFLADFNQLLFLNDEKPSDVNTEEYTISTITMNNDNNNNN